MNIKMAGIDHRRAGVETRELFSFTKSGAQKAMKLVREKFHAAGCILLSTCNRTELWLDGGEESPLEILCELKGWNRSSMPMSSGCVKIPRRWSICSKPPAA